MFKRFLIPILLATAATAQAEGANVDDTRRLLLRGRYAEAIEAAQTLAADQPIDAALLQSEALLETGQDGAAHKLLIPLWEREVDNVSVARNVARLADRHWSNRDIAALAVDRLLKLEPDGIVARWLQAKRVLDDGKYDDARPALAWFAEHRGKLKPATADEALALANGLVEQARWSRESKWFNVAVNEVLGDAEKQHPLDWRLPAARARLFVERHNDPAAVDSLNAALAKNGSAAELHAMRARLAVDKFDLVAARRSVEQARRLNQRWPEIALVEADIAFAELQPKLAQEILAKANDEFALDGPEFMGRKLAAQEAMRTKMAPPPSEQNGDGQPPDVRSLIEKGDALDRMRRFGQAKEAYQAALQKLPDFPGIRAKLAHELLRLGEEQEGAKLLAEAQLEDPFDVRVKNTLAVLDVLSTYATVETDHFIIRFDRGRDELLARYVAEYLEQDVYPDLVKRFGYEPEGKSLIEIYNRSRNTSGHGWFSARMVGLPGLHTIGACAGKIVALASPTDMPRPYNWARVLRHEFVHLLNLEQTSFNVPHWVTEGLAVTAEDRPRPSAWTRLLTQRYADDELFTLDNINFGFIRPSDSNDWTCAYAQAELYIEFMTKTYGDESVPKLLTAFADNLSTRDAVEHASGVKVEEFEQGYRAYVGMLVDSWGLRASTASQNIDRLKTQLAADPQNADVQAALAAAHLAKGELPLARKHATQAVKLAPKQATAALVLATLARAQDPAEATRIAQAALDPQSPHEGLLLLLADLKLAEKQNALAEKLLLLGKRRFPSLDQWDQRLARLYATQKDAAKLEPVLVELFAMQEDDASLPAKLAEFALARKDFVSVEHWSRAALQIDVRHAAAHARLAAALLAADKPAAALLEWEAAVENDDKHPEWKLELARLLIKSGDRERAQGILEKLVETSPGLPGLVEAAQELRNE
jgi:predicted Zn-dependent protease